MAFWRLRGAESPRPGPPTDENPKQDARGGPRPLHWGERKSRSLTDVRKRRERVRDDNRDDRRPKARRPRRSAAATLGRNEKQIPHRRSQTARAGSG